MKYLFTEFQKAEERIVEGIATTQTPDSQAGYWAGESYSGDVVDESAIQEALDGYMKWANIREMHDNKAAGVALSIRQEDGTLYLKAKIVDEGAWEKVKEGVYKGFSIGGRVVKAIVEKLPDGRKIRRILKIVLTEISLVDRPANPDARILLWKGEYMSVYTNVIKAAQQARNEAEIAGNLQGASMQNHIIALAIHGAGTVEKADYKMDEASMMEMIKGLLRMMSTNGNEEAVRMMDAYSAKVDDEEVDKVAKSAVDFVNESMVSEFKKLAEQLNDMGARLKAIEEQPMPGGPVSKVSKSMVTDAPDGDVRELSSFEKAQIADLRQRANTEPNPHLREQYQRQLAGHM